MEIKYYGANCFSFSTKKVTAFIDDNLKALGGKHVSAGAALSIFTQARLNDGAAKGFVIDGQGEYEVSGVSVLGFSTRAHTDHEDEKTAVVYRVVLGGIIAGVLGHIYPNLTDEQLERLGTVDVLIVPVGGNGYTLDAKSAAKLVKSIEPKVIIPSHFDDGGLKYEVPQAPVDDFFKEVGATPEKIDTLKLKANLLPVDTQAFYLLERQ